MLTAMGKTVQQIATINNLLIFINIQISKLQKSSEGRAPGEGPVLAGIASLPAQAGRPGSCQFRGEGLRHLGPSSTSLGTRVLGWLKRLHFLACSGPGLSPALGSRGSGLRAQICWS